MLLKHFFVGDSFVRWKRFPITASPVPGVCILGLRVNCEGSPGMCPLPQTAFTLTVVGRVQGRSHSPAPEILRPDTFWKSAISWFPKGSQCLCCRAHSTVGSGKRGFSYSESWERSLPGLEAVIPSCAFGSGFTASEARSG